MKDSEINSHVVRTLRPAPTSQTSDQLQKMRGIRTINNKLKERHTHSFSARNRRTKAHYFLPRSA
jgi:hypothetical protein